eukprot:CAMPEP_0178425900 /NCGR_PEP_ID=MMETSP0689_2-20121128/28960_1 /TAXON_ID=160604 /ORGANISM="Amphidinium massartii, Strain CS-259" /LENGTH=169 /DNA_ID=CAMNT_0020047575 /DNA_START=187 /DNA_END=696 /DNA_ORIENTATION=-
MSKSCRAWSTSAALAVGPGGVGRSNCASSEDKVRGAHTSLCSGALGVDEARGARCCVPHLAGDLVDLIATRLLLPDAADPGRDDPADPVPAECRLGEQAAPVFILAAALAAVCCPGCEAPRGTGFLALACGLFATTLRCGLLLLDVLWVVIADARSRTTAPISTAMQPS